MLREASVFAAVLSLSTALLGQEDWRALRINEVIADNAGEPPVDVAGSSTDMIEIYNPTDSPIDIGTSDPATSLALTDSLELPYDDQSTPITEPGPYTFSPGLRIRAKGWVVVFCDDNPLQNLCEPHASFRISSAGDEPITLWGPIAGYEDDGRPIREVIDRVWLPPLGEDVSFGRYPDGAGPAPVPLDQTLQTFSFHLPGTSTFGRCVNVAQTCPVPDGNARVCLGMANAPGSNTHPRIELLSTSSSRPAAGEAVELRARVEDERSPLPAAGGGSIVRAQVRYRVDSGPVLFADLAHDGQGIRHAPLLDADGNPIDPDPEDPDSEFAAGENPFGVWAEWTGVLPGQPAGSRVEFHLVCEDSGEDGDPDTAGDNLADTSPGSLCDDVYPGETVGPCDREFGGPGCDRDAEDVVRCDYYDDDDFDGGGAASEVFPGVRYLACSRWFTYQVGHEVREGLDGLLITEVVASQTSLLMDPTEAGRACPADNPACQYDDLLELHNASAGTIDLSGLWLSRSPFEPREWQFPEGAAIDPGEYLVVWLDGDGGKCPCPSPTAPDSVYCERTEDRQPCFWRCPDPTDAATASYHASFSVLGSGEIRTRDAALEACLAACDDDEFDCEEYCEEEVRGWPDHPWTSLVRRGVYLFDSEEQGFGLIHSVEWDDDLQLVTDRSLLLYPDGSRDGEWILAGDDAHGMRPSPGAANRGYVFRRGDADEDGKLDVTDAVVVLSFLFLAGIEPSCREAANANDDERLDISDGISILRYLFLGGPPPPSPGPPGGPCGPDPETSPSHLGCASYAGC